MPRAACASVPAMACGRYSRRSSPARPRRITMPPLASTRTVVRCCPRQMLIAAYSVPAPAGFTRCSCGRALDSRRKHVEAAGRDCALHDPPLHPSKAFVMAASRRGTEIEMRAEVERLVEEIKQSVGLLRRHL